MLTAAAAAKLLGVKRATLYSYASRGWLRAMPGTRHRERLYPRVDIERLKARASARSGHGAVAAGAMSFGEPVLDSAITAIRPDGPWYRGRQALELSRTVPFEAAAELLWTGAWSPAPEPWPTTAFGPEARALRQFLPPRPAVLGVLLCGLPALAMGDEDRHLPGDETLRARRVVRSTVGLIALARGRNFNACMEQPSVAGALARALGLSGNSSERAALDAALVLCADQELNVSSFAARVAASAGADLYACLTAALATFTGPRHGAESARIEAALAEVDTPAHAARALRARLTRGDPVPGFGHALYPDGDPRGRELLVWAHTLCARNPRVRLVEAWVKSAESMGLGSATLDVGLVALCRALGLSADAPALIFAVGRMSGWVAHVLEQRSSPALLRPRARYVESPEMEPAESSSGLKETVTASDGPPPPAHRE